MLRFDNVTHASLFLSPIFCPRINTRICQEDILLLSEFLNILVIPIPSGTQLNFSTQLCTYFGFSSVRYKIQTIYQFLFRPSDMLPACTCSSNMDTLSVIVLVVTLWVLFFPGLILLFWLLVYSIELCLA